MKKMLEKIGAFLGYKYIRYGIAYRFECLKHKEDINFTKSILADALSTQILDAAIKCRKTRNNKYLKPFFDAKIKEEVKFPSGHSLTFDTTQYFLKDIVQLSNEEVFVDGGGYIGDTSLQFIKTVNGCFKKIHIFEPIAAQYNTIQYNTNTYKDKIAIHHAGLSSSNEKLVFTNITSGSRKAKKGQEGEEVQLVALDTYLSEQERSEITYIKLDVEGVELAALQGMKETIVKNKSKLAVCIYHKPKDLWEIPLFINQLNPDYKLYIRQHNSFNETVLYAIP